MEFQHILYTERDGIAIAALNRPEAFNAISDTMRGELRAVADRLREPDAPRALILTGEGKAFCAGGDVKLMKERVDTGVDYRERLESYRRDVADMVRELRSIRQPTVAAINGAAFGAGCSIAMLCDIRIAAEGVKFGLPFGKRGLIPDWGATYFLPRLVGAARAVELMATGRTFTAREAWEMGLVSRVVPADELMNETVTLCREMLLSGPLAVQQGKRAIYESLECELDTALEREAKVQSACFCSDDHREGVESFLDKREARFTGR